MLALARYVDGARPMQIKIPLFVVASIAVCACGSSSKQPPIAPTGGSDESGKSRDTAAADSGKNPKTSQINISEDIRRACGISASDAHFAFNSASVQGRDARVLGQLAKCFTSGPLAKREMRLVGHADPRGESEYNMVLAGQRADNVKQYIVKKGMTSNRVATTSRGEMDATGTNEQSWAEDRRVDVVLGN